MEIEYNFPGSMKIELDDADLQSIRTRGFCMDRNGFRSIESKTWVFVNRENRDVCASIDGDSDLNIHIPAASVTPVVIEKEKIFPGNEVRSLDIVEHFLAGGTVEVSWPQ